jgi:hypothetical protein
MTTAGEKRDRRQKTHANRLMSGEKPVNAGGA